MSDEERKAEKLDEQRALPKITDALTTPHGIPPTTPEIVDTQARLGANEQALSMLYHRTIADRFKMLEGKMGKGDVVENFANRLSMLTWADHGKAREEWVLFGRGMREDKPRLQIEDLSSIEFKPPEGAPERKKRLGIF